MGNNLSKYIVVVKRYLLLCGSYQFKGDKMNNETIQSVLHGYIEDEREYAREEAREETLQERNIEIVNNMLNKGYSLKEINEITQLELNTIKHLSMGK